MSMSLEVLCVGIHIPLKVWQGKLFYVLEQTLSHLHTTMGNSHGSIKEDADQCSSLVQGFECEGYTELCWEYCKATFTMPTPPHCRACKLRRW